MKNYSFFLFAVLLSTITIAQEKLITRTGEVTFLSETAMEDIEAKNTQTASIFLVDKKTIAFNVLLRSFKFEKALMEEHFNEKYVHSDKYPAAKFKGVIEDDIDLKTAGVYKDITINGTMTFHGVTKPIQVKGDITKREDGSISFNSQFNLKLEDFKIQVPSLVKDKISKDIKVSVATNYK